MKNSLVIIGAGGHGRVCAEIAELNGYQKILFLDDGNAGNIEIAGKTEDFIKYLSDCDFFVAIGNNNVRRSFLYRIMENKGQIATLIHPDSTVSLTELREGLASFYTNASALAKADSAVTSIFIEGMTRREAANAIDSVLDPFAVPVDLEGIPAFERP